MKTTNSIVIYPRLKRIRIRHTSTYNGSYSKTPGWEKITHTHTSTYHDLSILDTLAHIMCPYSKWPGWRAKIMNAHTQRHITKHKLYWTEINKACLKNFRKFKHMVWGK